MPSPPGHPAHQLRPFTIAARRGSGLEQTVTVEAQTEHDALFRAGMILAGQRFPLGGPVPAEWIVTGITDPAARTWTPPAALAGDNR
jgi:hypothetical protein